MHRIGAYQAEMFQYGAAHAPYWIVVCIVKHLKCKNSRSEALIFA